MRVSKKANLAVATALEQVAAECGAVRTDEHYHDEAYFRLETICGELHILISPNIASDGATAFCRFEDVDRAAKHAPGINPYSGKWNHHYWSRDAAASAADFRRSLESILVR